MNIMEHFIKKPVQAIVLNAFIILVGVICYQQIALREYPKVDTPKLSISTTYPNASAELVENRLTAVLEDSLSGVEGIDEIHSESKFGRSYIALKFHQNLDLDKTQVKVREALSAARQNLPKDSGEPLVSKGGKAGDQPGIFMALTSDNMSFAELTHYANQNLKNPFRSLKGVSEVTIWGQPYTMSVNLDPKKLYSYGINVQDIYTALEKSQLSLPVGKYQNEVPATLTMDLASEADFQNVPIHTKSGKVVWLKDIADISLKSDDKQFRIRINGQPGLVLTVDSAVDANPLAVSKLVTSQIESLKSFLPPNIHLELFSDQANYIKTSLDNIQTSLIEAVLFVLMIVFIALAAFRATLIPLVTIPISLLGSIIFLKIFGYSINTITLLAMIMAVGLVVDDAIVILENIARLVEKGLSPLEAAVQGSREIGFAIVGMTLTLASVYAPIAFIPGTIGQLFVEFAVTLAGAVLVSGVVALTLSPLMCTKLLKKSQNAILPTDKYLSWLTAGYSRALAKSMSYSKLILISVLLIIIASVMLYKAIPSELTPVEDQGVMSVYVPPIPGKSIDVLEERVVEIEQEIKSVPEVDRTITYMGNWGSSTDFYLHDYAKRKKTAKALSVKNQKVLNTLPSMDAWAWTRDSRLPGVDASSKGSLQLAISTLGGYPALLKQIDGLRQALDNTKKFTSVYHHLRLDAPGYQINYDMQKLAQLGLSLADVAKTIEIFFSGQQSLLFEKDSVAYPITLESSLDPWTLDELYVIDTQGRRISVGAFANIEQITLPKSLDHYQQMRTAYLYVTLPSTLKMKEAMDIINPIIQSKIDPSFKTEWIGSAKMQGESNKTMILLFGLAIIFIYAVLAVLFNNFIDPFIILFTVPLGCFGGLLLTWAMGQSLNIYSQIGLVTLIGLITKHGILIVAFTNQLLEKGVIIEEAIREACVLRLRPILMTTAAMTIGSVPLMLSTGAGSEARQAIGIVLVGGLLFGTVLTLFILPKMVQVIKQLQLPKSIRSDFDQMVIRTEYTHGSDDPTLSKQIG